MPRPKEQSNFTDPDSRIMKSSHGWIQGYNAQVLVEEGSGVIVAQEVTAQSSDSPRLGPVLWTGWMRTWPVWVFLKRSGVPDGSRRTRGTAANATWGFWLGSRSTLTWPRDERETTRDTNRDTNRLG